MIWPAARPLRRFVRTPKGLLLILFVTLAALATLRVSGGVVSSRLLVAAATASLIEEPLYYWRERRWVLPDGAVLTGMIVAFVLRPQEPWTISIAAVALAIASKHLLRTRWSNVFNPAALALVFAAIVLKTGQSWWGALPDLGLIGAFVLLATGAVLADHLNKLTMILAFFATYFLLFTAAGLVGSSVVSETFLTPDLQAVLFFAFFMLDDPPTSPVRHEDQVVFGVIVASVAYFVFMRFGGVYYLPAGLLAGNLWESGRRYAMSAERRRRLLPTRTDAILWRRRGGAVAAVLLVLPLALVFGKSPQTGTLADTAVSVQTRSTPVASATTAPLAVAPAPTTRSLCPSRQTPSPFEPSFDSNFSGHYTQSMDAAERRLVVDGTATGDFSIGVHVEVDQHVTVPTPDDETAEPGPDDETAESQPVVTTTLNTAQLIDPGSKGLLCDGKLTSLGGGEMAFDCNGRAAYIGVNMQITSQVNAASNGSLSGILSGTMQRSG